jgi:DNA-binding response OmpR family regulator
MMVASEIDVDSARKQNAYILVVDDEQDILPEYQEFFESAGFLTLTCANPVEAFDIILNTPEISVVITDLRMANLDGASMIRDLRAAFPTGRRVDFIILTGDASTQPIPDIADVPIFLKPADTGALVAAIRAALARP